MQIFQDQMIVYTKEHTEVKECVRALDESLNSKATKVEYFDLRNKLELYMTKEEVADNDAKQQENIDYFTDFQVIENWEREKEEDPLFDTVDFIVTKSLFTVKSDIKVSQFGELFVYEKNR